MRTSFIYNNADERVEVISGLKKGDKLIAIGSVQSKGDIGMSGMTFNYEAFIVGKTYFVDHLTNWDGIMVAYVADEDNTLHFATPKLFELP